MSGSRACWVSLWSDGSFGGAIRSTYAFWFALSTTAAFGCAAPDSPLVASRTSALVDAGAETRFEVVDVAPAVLAATQYGLCNTVADCATTIWIAGTDLFTSCLSVECRTWEGLSVEGVHGSGYQGRCYVSRKSSLPLACAGSALTTALTTATIGVANAIDSVLGLGERCDATTCAPGLSCVDGVCCENACGDGNPSDCFACSVEKGGGVDGRCLPVLGGNLCAPSSSSEAEACFVDGVCGPRSEGGATTERPVFDGVCRGVLADRARCCDPDGALCEGINVQCVDFECTEVDAGVRDAGLPDAPITRDANMLDASRLGDADTRDAAPDDMRTAVDAVVADAVVADAAMADAEMKPDAALASDASAPSNTPIFRGGGGIRCAVSSPGASNGENKTAAGALSLAAAVICFIRRRRTR